MRTNRFFASQPRADLLIVGLGDALRGDEALGTYAARHLRRTVDVPAGTHIVQGDAGDFDWPELFHRYRAIVLIDVVREPERAGEIRQIPVKIAWQLNGLVNAQDPALRSSVDAVALTPERMPTVYAFTVAVAPNAHPGRLSPAAEALLGELCARIESLITTITAHRRVVLSELWIG